MTGVTHELMRHVLMCDVLVLNDRSLLQKSPIKETIYELMRHVLKSVLV